jgi:DhnA family fructose-bisphosphate aldolase class Ia
MMEELRELAEEAKAAGLAVVVWSYPRGPMLDKNGETAFDICAYAAHMARADGGAYHQGEAAHRCAEPGCRKEGLY